MESEAEETAEAIDNGKWTMTATSKNTVIEICGTCKGEGVEEYEHRISGHEWEMRKRQCRKCEGSGRLRVTIEKSIEPFVSPSPSMTVLKGQKKRKDQRF